MENTENNLLRLFLGIFIVLFFTVNVNSWVVVNGSEWGFDEESQQILEEEILFGASSFLNSYSAILNFFQRIELRKIEQLNFDELRMFVDQAVLKMENSRDAYLRLNQKAAKASYNLKVINRLVIFDFGNFQNERELNTERFSEVRSFLSQGDVRGVYNKILIDSVSILTCLYGVKNTVDSGIVPDTRVLWKLNRLYLKMITFGQYVANVFYKVTGK